VGVTLALLTSLMTMALPASALSQPTVTLGLYPNSKISQVDADYTIIFTLGKDLEATDTITITFPAATTVATQSTATDGTSGNITGTVTASPGWVGGVWTSPAVTTNTTWKSSATYKTLTLTVGGAHSGNINGLQHNRTATHVSTGQG